MFERDRPLQLRYICVDLCQADCECRRLGIDCNSSCDCSGAGGKCIHPLKKPPTLSDPPNSGAEKETHTSEPWKLYSANPCFTYSINTADESSVRTAFDPDIAYRRLVSHENWKEQFRRTLA